MEDAWITVRVRLCCRRIVISDGALTRCNNRLINYVARAPPAAYFRASVFNKGDCYFFSTEGPILSVDFGATYKYSKTVLPQNYQ